MKKTILTLLVLGICMGTYAQERKKEKEEHVKEQTDKAERNLQNQEDLKKKKEDQIRREREQREREAKNEVNSKEREENSRENQRREIDASKKTGHERAEERTGKDLPDHANSGRKDMNADAIGRRYGKNPEEIERIRKMPEEEVSRLPVDEKAKVKSMKTADLVSEKERELIAADEKIRNARLRLVDMRNSDKYSEEEMKRMEQAISNASEKAEKLRRECNNAKNTIQGTTDPKERK